MELSSFSIATGPRPHRLSDRLLPRARARSLTDPCSKIYRLSHGGMRESFYTSFWRGIRPSEAALRSENAFKVTSITGARISTRKMRPNHRIRMSEPTESRVYTSLPTTPFSGFMPRSKRRRRAASRPREARNSLKSVPDSIAYRSWNENYVKRERNSPLEAEPLHRLRASRVMLAVGELSPARPGAAGLKWSSSPAAHFG